MIEPRFLIRADGRSRLLRDDFAVGENGFIGPALASHALSLIDRPDDSPQAEPAPAPLLNRWWDRVIRYRLSGSRALLPWGLCWRNCRSLLSTRERLL
jgi:hypothetical protein